MATIDYIEEFYTKFQHFKFDSFDDDKEDWDNYIGRFELKLKEKGLRDISPRANALKRDLLVSSLIEKHFQLLRAQVCADLEALTFQDVCQAMASRYRKKKNPFVERREFSKCFRRPKEDVRSFESRLRTAAFHCHYGPILDNMLLYQFIIGLNDTDVQEKLLSQFSDLEKTLDDAVKCAALLFSSRDGEKSLATSNQATEVISYKNADFGNG